MESALGMHVELLQGMAYSEVRKATAISNVQPLLLGGQLKTRT